MDYQAIKYEKKDGVGIVTLNQPESLNPLVQPVLDELALVTREIAADGEIKVMVLTGAGRAFCAGGDINRFKDGFDHVSGVDYVDGIHPWCLDLIHLKKPTIAMINGPAVGAGMSLALMCDISIASDQAKIGSAFINMGLIPDLAAAYYLPRAVGLQKAKELLYTGMTLDAQEALAIGLVNRVVPHQDLEAEVMKLAGKLVRGPGFALANTKRIVNMGQDVDLSTLLEMESYIQSVCLLSDDSKGAVNAFLNKEKYGFTGR